MCRDMHDRACQSKEERAATRAHFDAVVLPPVPCRAHDRCLASVQEPVEATKEGKTRTVTRTFRLVD